MYDALGRMVENTLSAGTREYLYGPAGTQPLAQMNGATPVTVEYPLPGGGMAMYNSSAALTYAHADWLGSGRLVTNSSQQMVNDSAYAPFGEQWAVKNIGFSGFYSFTGQQQWTVSGSNAALDDFLFRRYHPVQGRWITPDPAGLAAVDLTNPQTWNRYAYVGNNPLNATDPLGLYCAVGNPDTGATLGGCNPEGDVYFGSGWSGNLPGPGGWGLGGSGFSSTSTFSLPCGGDIDFPCSLPVSSPIQSILDLFNVPTDLNCPIGASFLCGGINPAMDIISPQQLNNCIKNNASTYSIGGYANLISDAAFGVQIPGAGLLSNTVTDTYLLLTGQSGLLSSIWGSGKLGAQTAAAVSPPIMTNGPRALTSLAPSHGSPQPILGPGTNYRVPGFGRFLKALGQFKIAADIGFSGALVLNCSIGQAR